MSRFCIGQEDHEFISIEIVGRAISDGAPLDYWENNWLTCLVEVRSGGFCGSVQCQFLTEEFVRLRQTLRDLHDWSDNELEFVAIEGWLTLSFAVDERGRIMLIGQLTDRPMDGNRLRFALQIDQSFLPSIISDLDRVIREYPIIGTPPLPQ